MLNFQKQWSTYYCKSPGDEFVYLILLNSKNVTRELDDCDVYYSKTPITAGTGYIGKAR